MIATTGDAIAQAFNDLRDLDPDTVREQRREKFLDIGRRSAEGRFRKRPQHRHKRAIDPGFFIVRADFGGN